MFLPYASIAFFESVSEGSVLVMSLEMPSRSGTAKTLGAIAGRRPEPEQHTRSNRLRGIFSGNALGPSRQYTFRLVSTY